MYLWNNSSPELEGVTPAVFKHPHDLITHPFHLRTKSSISSQVVRLCTVNGAREANSDYLKFRGGRENCVTGRLLSKGSRENDTVLFLFLLYYTGEIIECDFVPSPFQKSRGTRAHLGEVSPPKCSPESAECARYVHTISTCSLIHRRFQGESSTITTSRSLLQPSCKP